MNTTKTETRDEALVRLAADAKRKGVQILTYQHTGEWYATSISNPGTLHRVTVISCDCAGFFRHGRCSHHAALLAELGELPEIEPDPTPDPDPAETTSVEIVCEVCAGDGYDGRRACRACRGRGKADISVAVIDLPHFDAWEMEPNALRGAQCSTCEGDGFRLVSTGSHLSDWNAEPCARCQGAGLVPLPAPEWSLIAA